MTYWRMQLHPNQGVKSEMHAGDCLSEGYIGLDFHRDVGPLPAPTGAIEKQQIPYRLFESEMREGDLVLVQAGFRQFALVTVDGPYEYVSDPNDQRGQWFRHRRHVRDVRLYADHVLNPADRKTLPFRRTLIPIRNLNQPAFHLIES